MRTLNVELAERTYPIRIGAGLVSDPALILPQGVRPPSGAGLSLGPLRSALACSGRRIPSCFSTHPVQAAPRGEVLPRPARVLFCTHCRFDTYFCLD